EQGFLSDIGATHGNRGSRQIGADIVNLTRQSQTGRRRISTGCYRGDCRLLSVREAGRPLASAELELRREHGEPLGRPWNPQHLSTVQLRKLDNDPVPADSPAGQAYRWFMERIRSGAIATNLNWPDMTVHMTRFADGRWKAGLAEATAKWLLTRLENR
ncbi:hypothetical protein LJG46_05430, partial [Pseudomonas aeruginosa]|nr:hypothetical protein [Pseudomonas aeruginosa]